MKEKLKQLNIRLTELSNYLNFSRPTLYKYLELYSKRKYSKIDYDVLQVFKFINDKKTVSKLQVIDFIINYKTKSNQLSDVLNEFVDTKEKQDLLIKLIEIFKEDNYDKLIEEIINKYIGGNEND